MTTPALVHVDKPASDSERGIYFWQHGADGDRPVVQLSTVPTQFTPRWCALHQFAYDWVTCPACSSAPPGTRITGHGCGVLLLHLMCRDCGDLSQGFPNDEATSVSDHPTRFHAMSDGWIERIEGGLFHYVCPQCIQKEKERQKPMAQTGTFKKEIKVKLDEKQKAERKDRLVAVETEIDSVKSDKRQAVLVHNEQLKDLNKERKGLLVACNSGVEEVEVECYQRVDERRGEMLTIRCDTQEVLTDLTRPLTAEERQLTLDDAKPKNGKPTKPPKAPKNRARAASDEDDEGEDDEAEEKPAAKPKRRGRKPRSAEAQA